jgi:hypothetical protein
MYGDGGGLCRARSRTTHPAQVRPDCESFPPVNSDIINAGLQKAQEPKETKTTHTQNKTKREKQRLSENAEGTTEFLFYLI